MNLNIYYIQIYSKEIIYIKNKTHYNLKQFETEGVALLDSKYTLASCYLMTL